MIVYSEGAFNEQPAPDWYREAEEPGAAGLGAYVETGDCLRGWDAVWVPSPNDWWPFQAQYLLPLIASASNLAIADRLNRIGNVLIAHARHGQSSYIDEDSGQSLIDIRRNQQRQMSYRRKP